jgi:hypothetical protein
VNKQFLAVWLVLLMLLNAFGCGGPQNNKPSTVISRTDAGLLGSTDVMLVGLPDASEQPDVPSTTFLAANGESMVPLREHDRAPFNGVLFNNPAVARIAVEFQAQQQRCLIERNRDVGLVVARYNADISSLRLALDSQERTGNILIAARDQDVARLNRLLDTQNQTNSGLHVGEGLVWAGGGLLLGVLIVGGIVIFANAN